MFTIGNTHNGDYLSKSLKYLLKELKNGARIDEIGIYRQTGIIIWLDYLKYKGNIPT